MLHLVGIKNCNKIRDTKAWLEEREIPFTFVDVKKEPLTRDELLELKAKVGLDNLINRRGMMWRKLKLADQDLSDNELLEKLRDHQNMMKRPLLIAGDAVMIGYDEEAMQSFIDEYIG